jgi:hypothetical protein
LLVGLEPQSCSEPALSIRNASHLFNSHRFYLLSYPSSCSHLPVRTLNINDQPSIQAPIDKDAGYFFLHALMLQIEKGLCSYMGQGRKRKKFKSELQAAF